MNLLPVILSVLILISAPAAKAEWKIKKHDQKEHFIHWDSTGEEAPSLDGLDELLLSHPKSSPLTHITFWAYFNNDPTIQGELIAEFEGRFPNVFSEAFKSGGNMHNPKILPLTTKFSECLRVTPTITKINTILSAHGYAVKRITHEKFSMRKDMQATPFYAGVDLILEPTSNKEAQQAVDSNPH